MPLPGYSQQEALAQLERGEAGASAGEGLAVDVTSALVPPPDDAPRGILGVAVFLLALTCIPFGNSMLQVSIVSLITKRVDRREVGTVLGLNSAFQSAANTVGPLAAGVLAQLFGLFAPFLAGAILLLILLGVARLRLVPGAEETASSDGAPPPPVGH
jgi:MFS family permease